MKTRGLAYLLTFISFIAAAGVACETLLPSATPTPLPTSTPAPTAAPITTATTAPNSNTTLVTFTDQNNDFQIDVPADWTHKTKSGQDYYWDTFTSPDGGAVVENYTYLKATSAGGTPWNDAEMKKHATDVLDKYYSQTSKPGDIELTEVKAQSDGSVRLAWDSKGGGYSGLSYYELRGTKFLLFTIDWGKATRSSTLTCSTR